MAKRSEVAHREIVEARDLLLLWYRRWQGSLTGVPDNMVERTKAFVERNGETIPEAAFKRDGKKWSK